MFKSVRLLHTFVTLCCIVSLTSCSLAPSIPQSISRSIASETEALDYFLAVDRFHYYITEFTHFHDGKQSDEVINALSSITAKNILDENISYSKLSNPDEFDDLIQTYLKNHYPDVSFNSADLVWNYNFLKRKLGEAFSLKEARLAKVYKNVEAADLLAETANELTITDVKPETMTLDSGHYISNRTTRAVFWDAIEEGRDIEFHLGETRDFVKNIEARNGEVLYELNPMARNYNKIYLVKYPGEEKYRIAISNIGGHDRLEHLVHQVSLSNLNSRQFNNSVKVIGDLDKFHERLAKRITGRLELLPKADRLVIGQKGAIDTVFTLFEKNDSLQNLFAQKPQIVAEQFELTIDQTKDLLEKEGVIEILDRKTKIEKVYAALASEFEDKPELLSSTFKGFDWDLNVAEMADYVFKNSQGKEIRWRVVSNVWGDEIVPVAKALKETGHNHVTYIGTAGAFPDKDYKVGDLVIPSHYLDAKGRMVAKGDALTVDGAKVGGIVEHVGSPFEETHQWLDAAKQRSDLVEIETNYLGRIFNGQSDHVRSYLLVSDILGSEGETLANASSSKRRNALNKLLNALFERDKALDPVAFKNPGLTGDALKHWSLRNAVDEAFPRAGSAFKYHIYANYTGPSNADAVKQFGNSLPTFTDDFHSKKLVEASEAITALVNRIQQNSPIPNLALPKTFLDGKWNPKTDPLKISLLTSNAEVAQAYRNALEQAEDILSPLSRWLEIDVVRGPPPEGFAKVKIPTFADADLLIRAFSDGAYSRFGLDSLNTYTGNPKYVQLPTIKSSSVCDTAAKFCSLSYFEPDESTRELLGSLPRMQDVINGGLSPRESLERAIRQLNDDLLMSGNNEEWVAKAELKIVPSLPDGKLAEIIPDFDPTKGLMIKLNITEQGLNNTGVVLEEMAHLAQITGDYFDHPLVWAEMTLNAKHGSRRSQLYLAKAEVDAMDMILDGEFDVDLSSMRTYFETRKAHAEKIVTNVKTVANQENKARRNFGQQWKDLQSALEKENLKLDNFIASNDRAKVRELIETYMPWEEMEPTEISSWYHWLDAMTEPVNESDKVVLFRGLADDLIRQGDNGSPFLMAKLLTKNQGNYTRRLRSLKTFRSKMATKATSIDVEIPTISMVLKAHSRDPFGSPLMSAADYRVASIFANETMDNGKIAAININPKRLLYNLISDYGENERLIPMILFPDEIVHIHEFNGQAWGENISAEFVSTVEGKIGRSLTSAEKNGGLKNRLAATEAWWNLINPEGISPNKLSESCRDVFLMFSQLAQ